MRVPTYSLKKGDEKLPLELAVARLTADFFPIHKHDFTELVVIFGGSAMHVLGRERYPIGPGDVFVVRGERRHGFADLRRLELLNLMFDPVGMGLREDELAALPGHQMLFRLEPALRVRHTFRSRLRLGPTMLAMVRRHAERMEGELKARRPGHRPLLRALLQELLVLLARAAEAPDPVANPPREELLRLGQSMAHLERHFREPLRLPDLARRAGMSVNGFLRAFRQVRGVSPIAHRLALQLDAAAALLDETPAWSVAEVAARSGFADSNYFSRQFRRRFGVAPREFRGRPAGELRGSRCGKCTGRSSPGR